LRSGAPTGLSEKRIAELVRFAWSIFEHIS
jgi:hypothetical protein